MNISSPGWDEVHSKVIKETFPSYIEQLVHILNLSILQGVFPSELKTIRVISIYKGDNKMIISNYRPVSFLTVSSKICERIMYNRLFNLIKKHNILYKYQFGFREKHGTNSALIVLTDKFTTAISEGNLVLGVFLDFSNHSILLSKLYGIRVIEYGIRGIADGWLHSYLCNRRQFVSFNNHCSDMNTITCGVP